MILCRLALIVSVLTFAAFLVVVSMKWPWVAVLLVMAVIYRKRKGFWSSAHGTATWADIASLKRSRLLEDAK
jgi:hypothetical protein